LLKKPELSSKSTLSFAGLEHMQLDFTILLYAFEPNERCKVRKALSTVKLETTT
jgi:hypothetical protein